MAADILPRNRPVTAVLWPLNGEVPCDKASQIKPWLLLLLLIALDNDRRRILCNSIDECLAVREDALHLHVQKQLAIKL